MKKYVIGDIHGKYKALKSVLKACNFDYNKDKLIILGDIVDGGERTKECVDELFKIKHTVFVLGNHDVWAMEWFETGEELPIWWHQGGIWTAKSYDFNYKNVPLSHKLFFSNAKLYHEEDNMIFVHGGFDPSRPMSEQEKDTLLWDRNLIEKFRNGKNTKYDKVFVGHTTTQTYKSMLPLKFGKLWMLDTGGGWDGKLTIMNVDTEEYWQSEIQKPKE